MKGNWKYIIVLALCFGTLITMQIMAPKPIDWSLSYKAGNKDPYGLSALRKSMSSLFPGQDIREEKVPLYNSLYDNNFRGTNYVIINNEFDPDTLDLRMLLNFVESGNNIFIAANRFSNEFRDTLKLRTSYEFDPTEAVQDTSSISEMIYKGDSSLLNFTNPQLRKRFGYKFRQGMNNTVFKGLDTSAVTVLGRNFDNEVTFIEQKFGKGKFFISTVPEAFTNYHFASRNYDYACRSISHLPPGNVLWDEYYKVGNVRATNDNPLRVLFANTSLRYAYYLAMISLLVFILIGIKRKQRIIPVIEPIRNSTLDFVGTVGTLYFQTGDHKNLADKKITYFLEYLRSSFQVKTVAYEDAYLDRVAALSGIDRGKIQELFNYFNEISMQKTISEHQLIKLNRLIEEFHKLNKR